MAKYRLNQIVNSTTHGMGRITDVLTSPFPRSPQLYVVCRPDYKHGLTRYHVENERSLASITTPPFHRDRYPDGLYYAGIVVERGEERVLVYRAKPLRRRAGMRIVALGRYQTAIRHAARLARFREVMNAGQIGRDITRARRGYLGGRRRANRRLG
jgi:hypothetical protein